MRVLKTKVFTRWARRDGPTDSQLMRAVEEMRRGLIDAGELQEVKNGKPQAS